MTYGNITNVARQASVTAIIACGMTIVVLSGGIDLSVGSIVALSSVIMAGTMLEYGLLVGLLAGIVTGALMGLFNGLVIAKGKVAPFVVTLGVMTIGRSFTLIYTGGIPISQFPQGFDIIGAGYILGALQAVKQAKANTIVIGFDGHPEAAKNIIEGSNLMADVAQQPEKMAKAAIEAAVKLVRNEEVAKKIVITPELVTKENAEKYIR